MAQAPEFVRGSRLLEDAYAVAYDAHQHHRKQDGDEIDHPLAVAELLHTRGFQDEIVAAALLHDVVEDTSIPLGEISARFGPEICRLVEEMTEDETIERYSKRKAEHRSRVSSNSRAAAIYAADKLAKTRELNREGRMPRSEEQLEHYVATLRELRRANPGLPFLGELSVELERLQAEGQR